MNFPLGNYFINPESFISLSQIISDSFKIRSSPIPKIQSWDPRTIAETVIRKNRKGKIIWAATGHFQFMWMGDLGMSFRGLLKTLPPKYIQKILQFIINQSSLLGAVPSVFSENRGFDMPVMRYDSLPWLIYCIDEYVFQTNNLDFLKKNKNKLQVLLTSYLQTHLKDDLLSKTAVGDWVDTVWRPSSTWNNICIWRMLKGAKRLGLTSSVSTAAFRKQLLKERFNGKYLTDYHGVNRLGVDACVLALYFKFLNHDHSKKIVRYLVSKKVETPFPIKATYQEYPSNLKPLLTRFIPDYHEMYWIHLGIMYLNGLKYYNFDINKEKLAIEKLVQNYQNFLEVVDNKGRPYKTVFHSCAYNFTMAAAQYLELIKK